MSEIRYTFLTDGPTDRALIPLLTWLLHTNGVSHAIQSEWADLRRLPKSKQPRELAEKMQVSIDLYPCNLLFVHRDAEREPLEKRREEILNAIEAAALSELPIVCVVPVRMQEAWLLFDEQAIRSAAGNPNGRQKLQMQPLKKLEALPDPKETLYKLLREASELHGRRLRRMDESKSAPRVSEYIDDFSPLRELPAFQALEEEVRTIVAQKGWAG